MEVPPVMVAEFDRGLGEGADCISGSCVFLGFIVFGPTL